MSGRMTTSRSAVLVGAAGLALLLAASGAQAGTSDTTAATTTASTSPSATATTPAESAPTAPSSPTTIDPRLGWEVIDASSDCGSVTKDARGATEMRQDQVLCLSDRPSSFTEDKLAADTTGTRFTVRDFDWQAEELASRATAELSLGGQPITIAIVPDLTLTVEWLDGAGEAIQPADGEPISIVDGMVVKKVIRAGGSVLDDLGPLTVRETLPGDLLTVRLSDDRLIEGDTVDLSLGENGSVSYQLRVPVGANSGPDEFVSETELRFDGVAIRTLPHTVRVEAPKLELDLQAAATAKEDSTLVKIQVTNTGTDLDKPFTVSLRPVEDPGIVTGFADASNDAEPDDEMVTWSFDGLGSQEKLELEVQARLSRNSDDSEVVWEAAINRTDAPTAVITDQEPMTVAGSGGTGEEPNVDFTPAQLIRLIAFVVAFALLAIIFGAWMRTRSIPTGTGSEVEAARTHELNLFKAFAESILVLVILVTILVLALQGRLEAQSAGSLIGVIAGYALGQGRR